MTLDEARAEFEALFDTVCIGPPCAKAWEGGGEYVARYVIITEAGVKEEAESQEPLTDDEDEAVRAWLLHATDYKDRAHGRYLIWRILPEIDRCPGYKAGEIDLLTLQPYSRDQAPYLRVYSRFLVADRLPDMAAA